MRGPWPKERDALLIRLHGTGIPFSEMALEIGERFNISLSRNACIGRARRLGLGSPEKPTVNSPAVRAPRRRRIRKRPALSGPPHTAFASIPETVLRCVEVVPRHLSLADLQPDDCRFPFGNGPITFCGHGKTAGSSYCLVHFDLSRKHPPAG
jgi:GcrA cell cycle regulator